MRNCNVILQISTFMIQHFHATYSRDPGKRVLLHYIKIYYSFLHKFQDSNILCDYSLFAVSGKNLHDDAPDACAMLVDFITGGIKTVTVARRPF